LPGDSLLFAAGTLAGAGLFNVWILFFVCLLGVVLGDNSNYWIGRFIGSKILHKNYKLINKQHVDKTRKFFHKYGAFALIIGRFMPIVRTFTPFLAGIGRMHYMKFLIYELSGAILWTSLFIFGGYFFGGLAFVKNNFSLIIILLIFVSFIPLIIQVIKHLLENRHKTAEFPEVSKVKR